MTILQIMEYDNKSAHRGLGLLWIMFYLILLLPQAFARADALINVYGCDTFLL